MSKKIILLFALLPSLLMILWFQVQAPGVKAQETQPATLDFSETGAQFIAHLMVNDKPITNDSKIIASDKLNLSVDLKIDNPDVNQAGSIYIVMLWNETAFMMKNDQGQWFPWDGNMDHLMAYKSKTLSEMESVEVISGLGGLTGQFAVYVGYKNGQTGKLIYNRQAITFQVSSVQQALSTSLHGTTQGMKYFYQAEQGGMEQFTHMPYETLPCQDCHVESSQCTTCHEVPGDKPKNDKCLESCHRRQQYEQQLSFDIHLKDQNAGGLGMQCADCHSSKQIHGDGSQYHSLHESTHKVDCQQSGCHQNVRRAGQTMHETHNKDLDCAACHVKNTMTCYTCHFEDGSAYQPPVFDWKLLVKNQANQKVTTANLQTFAFNGNTLLVVAPYHAHTIQKNSELTCASCHKSESLTEYNAKGTMTLSQWDDIDKTLNHMTGIIPIPSDWKTALKMDFIGKDTNGEWTYQKDSADAHQMLFADPIDVNRMPQF